MPDVLFSQEQRHTAVALSSPFWSLSCSLSHKRSIHILHHSWILLVVCRVFQGSCFFLIFASLEFENICEDPQGAAIAILAIIWEFFFSSRFLNISVPYLSTLKLVSFFFLSLCFASLTFLLMHSLRGFFLDWVSREQQGKSMVGENAMMEAIFPQMSSICVFISSCLKSKYINTHLTEWFWGLHLFSHLRVG